MNSPDLLMGLGGGIYALSKLDGELQKEEVKAVQEVRGRTRVPRGRREWEFIRKFWQEILSMKSGEREAATLMVNPRA